MDPPFINMCWWINDLILPELQVYRGQTYYFKVRKYVDMYILYIILYIISVYILYIILFQVQGGDSDALGTQNYHPFYITNNPNGGYGRKLGLERGQLRGFLLIGNLQTILSIQYWH